MRSCVLGCLLLLGWGLLLAGCESDQTGGCTYDIDCPGTQVCVEGVCRDWVPADPCKDVACDPGEICVDGLCVDEARDEDGDGFSLSVDCDDSDPDVNPDASEICNQIDDDCDGATDEDNVCGEECDRVEVPPGEQAPFLCDADTPCERCARYQDTAYYCRSLNRGPYVFLIIPDETPCDLDHHCDTLECAGQLKYCDGFTSEFQDGPVPTADQEICNGVDDDCDGQTDGPGAEQSCPPRDNATAACTDGACAYTCENGYHDCSGICLPDSSVDSCGTRCSPCPAPLHGQAVCTDGECDFVCDQGYYRSGDSCQSCNVDDHCGPDCIACADGLTCCSGACYDLLTDPDHCGACNRHCPTSEYTCCTGQGCCPAEHPVCCGPGCCDAGTTCCNDSFCCDAAHPVCCPTGCCPSDYPVCCDGYCCPAGTYCCGTECCPL